MNHAYLSSKLWIRLFSIFILPFAISGCADLQEYTEGNQLIANGQIEQGLAKLETATKLDSDNAKYRITLATQRASIINQQISIAENARRNERFDEAENAYQGAKQLDPNNAMANQGLITVAQAKRHQKLYKEAAQLFASNNSEDRIKASSLLRIILNENPQHKAAFTLKAKMDEVNMQVQRTPVQLAKAFQKPISLQFRDASLKSVLEVIAQAAGLNFFYDKEIRPETKVTIFVKNTAIADALRMVLVTNQLEQKILNGNSVFIYPNSSQKIKDYQTLMVRSFYIVNADVKAVANSIKTIVKTKDMVVDERLGIIILRDTADAIQMAEKIIALQDLSDPEVMLEVEVLEIQRTKLLELGLQWPSQLTLAPLQTTGQTLTLDKLIGINQATTQATINSFILNARKEDQNVNILANPRIRVRNREKAKIQIGDRVPVITTTATSTGFVSESINYLDVGLKLEVEPNIYLDEEVAIKINLEVSNLIKEVQSKSGTLSYQIGTRGATTVLRLKDGETQILAGLINSEDRSSGNRVPLLGELPVAGRLFGSQKDDAKRSEILLSITPHIVRAIRRPDLLNSEFESGTENSIGSESIKFTDAGNPLIPPNPVGPTLPSTPTTPPLIPMNPAPLTKTPRFESGTENSMGSESIKFTNVSDPSMPTKPGQKNETPSGTVPPAPPNVEKVFKINSDGSVSISPASDAPEQKPTGN